MEFNTAERGNKLGKVMIIDDDPTLRSLLDQAFRHAGYQTCLAQHGADAMIRIHKFGMPSIIILDLMMPVMDGWKFLELRQNMNDLAKVPVIVITGLDMTGALSNVAAKLTKPFDLFAMLSLAEKLLSSP